MLSFDLRDQSIEIIRSPFNNFTINNVIIRLILSLHLKVIILSGFHCTLISNFIPLKLSNWSFRTSKYLMTHYFNIHPTYLECFKLNASNTI
jgi:hypothetical protein